MGFLARLREHRRPVASVSTDDSGVRKTRTSAGLPGRFDDEPPPTDRTPDAGSDRLEVQQDAARVLFEEAVTGTASTVDVAHLELDRQVRLPAGAKVPADTRGTRTAGACTTRRRTSAATPGLASTAGRAARRGSRRPSGARTP